MGTDIFFVKTHETIGQVIFLYQCSHSTFRVKPNPNSRYRHFYLSRMDEQLSWYDFGLRLLINIREGIVMEVAKMAENVPGNFITRDAATILAALKVAPYEITRYYD